jgi:hypothetical protein
MVNRRQVIKSAAAAATVLVMPRYAFAAGAFNGFYPAGTWMPAKQAMIQVYPRPDTETNTYARHRWAYYDGTNAVQYKIPLGVSFGAFPYVFQLLSGPPGMTLGASYWQSGWSFAQAMAAGYGYLQWTPTAAVSGATVSVLVTDQQMNTLTITFTVSTSSSTSRFIFLDAANGNDSNGTGAIGAPWKTLTKALGSTYAATANPGAICYLRGTGTYSLPISADQDINTYWTVTELHTGRKPSALIGFPGDSLPVISMTNCFFTTNTGGADLFVQNLAPNGYNTSANSFRLFWVANGGTGNSDRTTFDGITWTNSGYGASAASNATGYFIDTTSGGSQYCFINGCSETNRQSGNAGNNYAGCSLYSVTNALIQACSINAPTVTVDEAWQPKSDVTNGCLRGNFTRLNSVQYVHSPLQAPNKAMNNVEVCYNTVIGGGGIFLPATSGFTYGPLWAYRNSVIGNTGFGSNEASSSGPYNFDSNVSQSNNGIPTGSSIKTDGLNVVVASGALDATTGQLTGTYRTNYLGTIGAEIALNSSALTPKSPSLNVS